MCNVHMGYYIDNIYITENRFVTTSFLVSLSLLSHNSDIISSVQTENNTLKADGVRYKVCYKYSDVFTYL